MNKTNKKMLAVLLIVIAISLCFFSLKIANLGLLPANYTIIETGTNYTAYNSLGDATVSENAATLINTVISEMTTNEVLCLSGNFSIDNQIVINKKITIDLSQAVIHTSVPSTLLGVFAIMQGADGVQILGGHTYTLATKTETGPEDNGGHIIGDNLSGVAIRINAKDCLIDGVDITGYTGTIGAIFLQWASSYDTITNCILHDMPNDRINCVNLGHNTFTNLHIYRCYGGIFFESTSEYNIISGCYFDHWNEPSGSHALYLDGADGTGGHNKIYNCEFCNPVGQAAFQIKSHCNEIYNNYFHDFASSSVVFSIYSQYNPSYACDNIIYNNVFSNINQAVWLGHTSTDEQPTQRNKFYQNTFSNVAKPFIIQPGSCDSTVDDTWIYYNKFESCPNIFLPSTTSYSTITNTVVAYNTFDSEVPTADQTIIKSYTNTMIYGNGQQLPDYNVPSQLQVSAPTGYIGATPIPTQNTTTYAVTIIETTNGTTSITGTSTVNSNSTFTISATPSANYRFDYWLINDQYSTNNPLSIVVTKDLIITPIFSLISSTPTSPPENSTNITSNTVPQGSFINLNTLIIPSIIILILVGLFIAKRKKNR